MTRHGNVLFVYHAAGSKGDPNLAPTSVLVPTIEWKLLCDKVPATWPSLGTNTASLLCGGDSSKTKFWPSTLPVGLASLSQNCTVIKDFCY